MAAELIEVGEGALFSIKRVIFIGLYGDPTIYLNGSSARARPTLLKAMMQICDPIYCSVNDALFS